MNKILIQKMIENDTNIRDWIFNLRNTEKLIDQCKDHIPDGKTNGFEIISCFNGKKSIIVNMHKQSRK